MNVAAILKGKAAAILCVRPETLVAEAAKLLAAKRIGAVLVEGGKGAGGLAGILSERDIVRGLADRGAAVLERPVSDLMTRDVVVTTSTHTIDRVMGLMTEKRIRHLPVVDNGALVGVISIGDVVKHRIAEVEREAEELRTYITAA